MTARSPDRQATEALTAALDAALPPSGAPIAVSHAARWDVLEALGGRKRISCPIVAGQTVWAAAEAPVAVVENPNRLGVMETAPPLRQRTVVVVRQGAPMPEWSFDVAIVEHQGEWTTVQAEAAVTLDRGAPDLRRFAAATREAQTLVKQLTQRAGVAAPHGVPHSPTFALLISEGSEGVLAEFDDLVGPIGVERLEFAGLPGGLLVTIRPQTSSLATAEFAARFMAGLGTRRKANTG